jgi:Protein related to penicillin acylase
MCRAHPVLTASNGAKINVTAACGVLAHWNGRADRASRGEVLWRQAYGGINYTDSWWRIPFDPAHPLTTPRDLNTTNPAVQHALADAVQFFRASHIPLGIPLPAPSTTPGLGYPAAPRAKGASTESREPSPRAAA